MNRVHNRNIHLEAEKIYPPTLNYISNSNLMGKNLLIAPSVKNTEKLLKINSTGNIESLNSNLHSILAQYPKLHAGIFVYDYISGKTVEINSDEIFPAASIIKIPVLLDLFNRSKKLEDEGFSPVDINEKMTFTEAHRTEGSGNLQYKSAGVDYSLDYLAKIMIRQSDNSATNMLLEYNGGINEINSSLRRWGFTKTQVNSFLPDLQGKNSTSPREIATLLYNIDNQNFLPLKSSASIKEYMSKVENRTLIKSQLPPDAIIIHKTGDIGKMLGDAGIVYSPSGRKYIMSIMVKRPHNDYSARDLIQKAAKAVYDTLGK
ncbi:MAG: class A beta-lactamase-related serine hydrolase [Candidatus Gastranaerophilales bacterium]|nr:class A beta-lactamase-related serine hydrolase [Candidatus Gastranaerophilales bacterium]